MQEPQLNLLKMKDIDVLIVDDHKLFAESLKAVLNRNKGIQVVEIVHLAKGLFSFLETTDNLPHVVLLDIRLPDLNGIDVVKHLKREYPQIKIIMVSMIDDDVIILETIKLGISSFLNKSSEPAELIQAIKDVVQKGTYVSIEMARAMRYSMQEIQESAKNYPVDEELTAIEKQVVILLCEEKSNKEIAELIHRSVRSVENIRKRITDKIGAKNVVGIVKYGYDKGLYKPSPKL